MKNKVPQLLLMMLLLSVAAVFGQSGSSNYVQRPRIVAATPTPTPLPPIVVGRPASSPTPTPIEPNKTTLPPIIVGKPSAAPTPTPIYTPRPLPSPTPFYNIPAQAQTTFSAVVNPLEKPLSLSEIRAQLAAAKRTMQSRPLNTAMTQPTTDGTIPPITSFVTIAIYEPRIKQTHFVTLPKDYFLLRDFETVLPSSLNRNIRVRIIRTNGVNTAVLAFDEYGKPIVPLLAQYPVERNGSFYEMAYYVSGHPALLSPEVTRAGQLYIRTIFDTANKHLRERGVYIAPEVLEVAERLAVVEHIDHGRFNTENRQALYEEVYSLYALNEGNTYRYAVSTAGAGGIVQMIPSTYRMVRDQYPQIPLMPDFVEGMRNHVNATEAMLLYMSSTWNDLRNNSTVQEALGSGIATPAELMSAGYNSNPAKLPGYIKRGGANWKFLIPRETQMYHRIYDSLQSLIILPPRPIK